MSGAARLRVRSLTVRHAGAAGDAVRGVSFELGAGEHAALMGASGSGKSTLLLALCGLIAARSGQVEVDGADVTVAPPHRRGASLVPQEAPVYPHLSVVENVAMPLRAAGVPRAAALRRAAEMAGRLGLGPLLARRADALSGGERRRAALGRALVLEPAVLLLDEPFAALDPPLREAMRSLVREAAGAAGCACLHATHDGAEAMRLGDRVLVLDAGRLVDDGPPMRVWSQPRGVRAALLVGPLPMNVLPGTPPRGVRAEHLRVRPAQAGASAVEPGWRRWDARVRRVEPQGGHAVVVAAAEAARTAAGAGGAERFELRALVPADAAPAPGDAVWMEAPDAQIHAFPAPDAHADSGDAA